MASLRHEGGDKLWKAIGNMRVVSSQPKFMFRKNIMDLELKSNTQKVGGKEVNKVS